MTIVHKHYSYFYIQKNQVVKYSLGCEYTTTNILQPNISILN